MQRARYAKGGGSGQRGVDPGNRVCGSEFRFPGEMVGQSIMRGGRLKG
jgi:hypothetical protein